MTRKFTIYVERRVTEEYLVETDDSTDMSDVCFDYLAFIDGLAPEAEDIGQAELIDVEIPDA